MMYDAIVIGSGPAGYECARKIAELGGKVAIVEKNNIGGTCTNYGCIPTKALHASASLFSDVAKASAFGFTTPSHSAYFKAVMERKDRVVKIMSQGVKNILDEHDVKIISGEAKIKDKHAVVVAENEFKAKNIVIAAGAKPRMLPDISIGGTILTSKEMLELTELPSSLLIIGGGYIGCEFASIFSSLGVKVKIIEMMTRIAAGEDADISKELARLMERQGIEIFTSASISKIDKNKVMFMHDNQEKTAEGDKILIAIGMDPCFNREEIENVGIRSGNGIRVNNKMQTSIENIYAVGDVTNRIKLAHYAYAQAEVAAKNIMGYTAEFDENIVPSAIFTIPEISSVGVRNEKLCSSIFRFAANGKARAMGEADGFVKIYYENGYLKGFCAIGPHASDLVAEATLAIKNRIPLEKIKETIHIHPTLSEAFLGAVEMALKKG